MGYNPLDQNNMLTEACAKAIKENLEKYAPSVYITTFDDDGVSSQSVSTVPILLAGDEVNYTEYTTPSIIVFNPEPRIHREILTNKPRYRDFDYDGLTAKALFEPVPIKLRYKMHFATVNPKNTSKLALHCMKMQKQE